MRAILEAFPGASIDSVTDNRVDAYGLLAEDRWAARHPELSADAELAELEDEP